MCFLQSIGNGNQSRAQKNCSVQSAAERKPQTGITPRSLKGGRVANLHTIKGSSLPQLLLTTETGPFTYKLLLQTLPPPVTKKNKNENNCGHGDISYRKYRKGGDERNQFSRERKEVGSRVTQLREA